VQGPFNSSEKMKIGIDAHAAERDGSGNCTYIRNYLKALKEIDQDNEYILYATDKKHPFYENFTSNKKFKIKQLPIKNPLIRIPVFLAKETYLDSLDILHVQYISPPFFKGKLVVTIHDLCFLHFPETFSKFEAWRLKTLIPLTARKSSKIITGSHYSKSDIIRTYRVDPEKIEVIPYGVSSNFKPEKNPIRIRQILDKYNISRPYILSVGRLNPRKNLVSLARAYSILKERESIPHKLVIVGKKDYDTKEIIQSIEEMEHANNVIITGFVPDDDLPYLYYGAEVFVYPSLFEGVGLPVLEAMKSGVPVVASNTSSLIEIVGDAGIIINPLSSEEMAQAISRLIKSQNLRRHYREKGLQRAEIYSWKVTAQKTLTVYEETYRNNQNKK